MLPRWKNFFLGLLLFAVLIVVSPYVINAVWILGNGAIHQFQRHREGSSDYELKSELVALSPLNGISVITVKNGNITDVTVEQTHFPEAKHQLQDYQGQTIEGMFQKTYACALNYPWLRCSFDYDPEFGYPKKVIIDCPNPDMCAESIDVIEISIFVED